MLGEGSQTKDNSGSIYMTFTECRMACGGNQSAVALGGYSGVGDRGVHSVERDR